MTSASNILSALPHPEDSPLRRANRLLRDGQTLKAAKEYAEAVLEPSSTHPSILTNLAAIRRSFQSSGVARSRLVLADPALQPLLQDTDADHSLILLETEASAVDLTRWARQALRFCADHPAHRVLIAADFIPSLLLAFFYRLFWGAAIDLRVGRGSLIGADHDYWQTQFNNSSELPEELQSAQQRIWFASKSRRIVDSIHWWDPSRDAFATGLETSRETEPTAGPASMSPKELLAPLMRAAGLDALISAFDEVEDGGELEATPLARIADSGLEPTVHSGQNALSRPELFDLRSRKPGATMMVFGHARSLLEAGFILEQAGAFPFAFDLFLSLDNSSYIEGFLPCGSRSCRHFDLLLMPTLATGASSLLWLVQGGVTNSYHSVVLVPATPEESSVQRVNVPDFNQEPDLGISAQEWTQLAEVINEFSEFRLVEWFARYGTPAPTSTTPVPTGVTAVRSLLLNQLAVMRASPDELEPADHELRRGCDIAVRTALGALAVQGNFRIDDLQKPGSADTAARKSKAKLIAFYLPQFHTIPENDEWWGRGFTEWHYVSRATPLFRNHYQPKLPADLGFYDLQRTENQEAQAALARQFGIHGFCYYYYWFDGKKLLEQPLEQMLRSGRPDFPFCVCWANENWTRQWDGQKKNVLMAQSYSAESNRALIGEFIKMMQDPRYIRHEGKPVLIVYRIRLIPDWKETAAMWREECRRAGVGEIHLCSIRFSREPLEGPPEDHGLDAYVLFPPQDMAHIDTAPGTPGVHSNFRGTIFSYEAMASNDLERFHNGAPWPVHRGVTLGWDNTARRRHRARIFTGCSPMRYRAWLKGVLEQEKRRHPEGEPLVFINAWNEWAEGTYLEPDQRYGDSYLAATESALAST